VIIRLSAFPMAAAGPVLQSSVAIICSLCWLPAITFFALAALWKALGKWHSDALARHSRLRGLRGVPWRQFESLVETYYSEQKCTVLESTEAGPDGGIEFVL
jgi:hypothetical protein